METTTDRALEAAAAAAREVIEAELGEGVALAFLFAASADNRGAGPNASYLAAATNVVREEGTIDLGAVFAGLVVGVVSAAKDAGANVAAFPMNPPSSN